MMQSVVSQSDGCPQCRQGRRRRHVDGVQILIRQRHREAVFVLPKMRGQGTNLIYHRDAAKIITAVAHTLVAASSTIHSRRKAPVGGRRRKAGLIANAE